MARLLPIALAMLVWAAPGAARADLLLDAPLAPVIDPAIAAVPTVATSARPGLSFDKMAIYGLLSAPIYAVSLAIGLLVSAVGTPMAMFLVGPAIHVVLGSLLAKSMGVEEPEWARVFASALVLRPVVIAAAAVAWNAAVQSGDRAFAYSGIPLFAAAIVVPGFVEWGLIEW